MHVKCGFNTYSYMQAQKFKEGIKIWRLLHCNENNKSLLLYYSCVLYTVRSPAEILWLECVVVGDVMPSDIYMYKINL